MKIAFRILVALLGAFLAVVWWQSIADPAALAARLDIQYSGPVGLDTLRADIGGFFLAGALCCFLALFGAWRSWLAAAMIVLLSALIGRLIGMAVDGFTAETVQALAIGVVMLLILAAAWAFGERRENDDGAI